MTEYTVTVRRPEKSGTQLLGSIAQLGFHQHARRQPQHVSCIGLRQRSDYPAGRAFLLQRLHRRFHHRQARLPKSRRHLRRTADSKNTGGICRAASTIYNAALRPSADHHRARYNHLWAPGCMPGSQDATVSYGALDYKFRVTWVSRLHYGLYDRHEATTCKSMAACPDDYDNIGSNHALPK